MFLWILRYRKKNKSLYFFQCLFGIFVFFQKNNNNLCVFPILYKCKYVLFHLNMLRLFQEINMFFFFEIKLVFNKKILP
jgi:hypothetical protein